MSVADENGTHRSTARRPRNRTASRSGHRCTLQFTSKAGIYKRNPVECPNTIFSQTLPCRKMKRELFLQCSQCSLIPSPRKQSCVSCLALPKLASVQPTRNADRELTVRNFRQEHSKNLCGIRWFLSTTSEEPVVRRLIVVKVDRSFIRRLAEAYDFSNFSSNCWLIVGKL